MNLASPANGSILNRIKNLQLGMQAKLLATAIPTLLLFTILVSFGIVERENNISYQDTVKQGQSIAKSAALLYTNARIYEELRMVDSAGMSEYLEYFMEDLMLLDKRMLSFFILNDQGQVLAHNNLREYGKTYTDKTTQQQLSLRQENVEKIYNDEQGHFLRITVPLAIGSKFWGLCRIDFSLNEMYEYNSSLRNEVILLSIFFLICSVCVVWLMGWHFVTPIKKLTATMNNITLQGEVTKNLPALPKRDDEIGELQNSFIWMITRLYQVEQEHLQNLEKMLNTEKMATVGQLASGLAHEINNPLGGTILCFQNLCEGDMDENTKQQHIKVINDSLEKIRSTLSDFLRFARPAPLSIRESSMQEIFTHCQSLADFTLTRQGISINVDIMEDMPMVQLDPDKIGQVLLNLLLNAAYAIDDAPNDLNKVNSVLLKAYVQDLFLNIIVADTGAGISKKLQEKIFTPFFSSKPEGKGTGLGLAVSHALIAQHGGTLKFMPDYIIKFDDIVYSGAVFKIKIPLHIN